MEATELRRLVAGSSADSHVFAPPQLAKEAAELSACLKGEQAVVFASSGSGGTPKWVLFRSEALRSSARAVNLHLEVSSADRWMMALPEFHVGGFGIIARAVVGDCGMRRFVGRWNAMRFVEEVGELECTLTSLVPTQVHDLVLCELEAPASLRAVVVGGAGMDEVEGQAARDLGWPILQSYGLTETASQVATDLLENLAAPFQNSPLPVLPSWEARVDESGCLQVRGEALFESYLRMEGGTLVRESPKEDGAWFATSDLVTLRGRALTVRGRADRQVKILGELVDVQAVEDELRAHLAHGKEVHVLLVRDERRGWRMIPVIEGEGEFEDLVEILNDRAPGFARVESARSVAQLPRTALGKVDVAALHSEIGTR